MFRIGLSETRLCEYGEAQTAVHALMDCHLYYSNREAILPAIRFKLTVHDISQTNLKKMDSLTDGMIKKKWLSMPASGIHAIIHAKEGLNLTSISHLYKETHAISHATSRLKADTQVIVTLDTRLEHEIKWTCKNSVTLHSENQFHQAIDSAPDDQQYVMQVKKTIKKNINDKFQDMWHNRIKTLLVKGRFLDLMNIQESFITWRSFIYNLPHGILQFAINVSIDTLATNANLKRWGKMGNSKCELCIGRVTLHHILNHCNAMLDRYLWCHHSILSYLYSLALSGNITDNIIYSDLSIANMPGISTIPIDITITTKRLDLVIVNRINSTITILELSVPYIWYSQ